jgi:vitellogenic carboxypeptidase-like protein
MLSILFLLHIATLFQPIQAIFKHRLHPEDVHVKTIVDGIDDDAVFITPLLKKDKDVHEITKVTGISGWNETINHQHSGFITIDELTNSNTFFWLSKSLDGNPDAPLLLWLQGGPGASSLFGLFTEIGPFNIDSEMQAQPRGKHSWNNHYHLLFIDNPVGTGFSFTDDASAFVRNQTEVGNDLYKALTQFFQAFPELSKVDFYVTGESYAGKYVPSCAYTIHERNQALKIQHGENAPGLINLAGISIGDGAMNPSEQFVNFGDLLWYSGMVDSTEREVFASYEAKFTEALSKSDYLGAFKQFDEMLNGDVWPYPTYYANVTGMGSNYFNDQQSPDGSSLTKNYFIDWLNSKAGRQSSNTGPQPYHVINATVEKYLLNDWMKDVLDFLVPLLEPKNGYKVLIYSGQNDIILGAPLTEQMLRKIDWSGKEDYNSAKKIIWHSPDPQTGEPGKDLAGYVRQVGKFVQAVVRGCGHMVPGDQPTRALDMIERFVDGKTFN